ncbi:DUF1877 family protein [Flavobacterium sp. MC2016-06]|uniref:DUF1877 family protein n=1 Tax=Flavobacterium sp. MC2016-06 TaxID=2676308 RepID=UPI0012BADBB8|nr:DUF1877 family protein [Flavobacterium sp. MC2016-06]MBU3862232.1 DUF1877 family protein [Flavobacterium sp. MC2016-06]
MGIDLRLFSISNQAKFVLEKAQSNIYYAIDFDKIQNIESLKLHLKMIQTSPDGTPEKVIKELIEDSIQVLNFYPDKRNKNYVFDSYNRCYATMDYLLEEYLKDKNKIKTNQIFYKGIDIECQSEWIRFQYLDYKETAVISDLLEPISFSELIKYYDFEKMTGHVYKLANRENSIYLEEEFNKLKSFYRHAKELDAFVIIKMN